MPDPVANSPIARASLLGNYDRLPGRIPGGAANNAPAPAPMAADTWQAPPAPVMNVAAMPVYPAAPAPQGVLARFVTWLKNLFRPVPTPPPAPAPAPVTPPLPEVATPGIQTFFTNTYGTTNQANQATATADPNNPDKQLVKLIDSVPAGGKLDGAFFDISVQDVMDAFIRAKQRGVDVRLVTEHDYYVDSHGAVRPPIQQLQAAGIPILPDDRGGLMHDKFLVTSGGPTGPTVWTGSYNITDGGTYHDNNNAMELQSAQLATIYDQEFEKMFVGKNFGTDAVQPNHPASQTVQIGNIQVTPYFSPSTAAEGGAKQAILNELANAHKSIQFLAFSFADADIGNAMLAKAAAGVKVQGVFETSQAKSRYSVYNKMAPAQAQLNGNLDVAMDGNPALMHHKVILVDDSTLIMGSFNFSKNAQGDNDENMLVIHNAPDLVAQYRAEFSRVQAVAKAHGGAKAEPGTDDSQG